MRYLLDSNVLIDADRDYYPIDRVPEFWEWLLHLAAQDLLKVPVEAFEEVKDGCIRPDEVASRATSFKPTSLTRTIEVPNMHADRIRRTNGRQGCDIGELSRTGSGR